MKKNILTFILILWANSLFAQNLSLFNLQNSYSTKLNIESPKSRTIDSNDLEYPIKIKVNFKNNSDTTIFIDNFDISYPMLNDENLLYIEKGFSYCIFDSNKIMVHPISILSQPALPDSIIENINIDTIRIDTNQNQNINLFKSVKEFDFSAKSEKYERMLIAVKPNKSIDIIFQIYSNMFGDFWSSSIPLQKNNKYFLKLFYTPNKLIEPLTDKTKLLVSDKIEIYIK